MTLVAPFLSFPVREGVVLTYSFRFSDKTIKLWKVSERDKRAEGYNILQEDGTKRDPSSITTVRVRVQSLLEATENVFIDER